LGKIAVICMPKSIMTQFYLIARGVDQSSDLLYLCGGHCFIFVSYTGKR